jgi:membrane protein implicated in regulation of membrane protease activity
VALVFAVVEVATVSLFAAFLAVGALGAAVVAFVGQGLIPQAVAFVAVAAVGVIVARPYLMRHLRRNASVETVSGAQAMIGENAIVVHRLNGVSSRGHVRILGENWPAITRDGSVIEEGANVRIVDLEGATLVVEALRTRPDQISVAPRPTPPGG